MEKGTSDTGLEKSVLSLQLPEIRVEPGPKIRLLPVLRSTSTPALNAAHDAVWRYVEGERHLVSTATKKMWFGVDGV